jgi:hypothetical protein
LRDTGPLGNFTVASLIGGFGDLTGKSLQALTGRSLPDYPYDETTLVRRAKAAWTTPLEALSCEQLRLLVGQGFGLEWLGPIACQVVQLHPNMEVSFYAGDLANAILRVFPEVLAADPASARAFAALDHTWIEEMREWNDTSEEAVDLLARARNLAAE